MNTGQTQGLPLDDQRVHDPDLQERYGLTPSRRITAKVFAFASATVFAAVLVAWVWWAGLAQPTAQLETRDLGYTAIDERTVSVRFDVSVDPGTEVGCAVQALNAQYGIVGWLVVDLPPSQQRTRVFDQVLRTSEPAVTGLLYECWLS